MDTHTHTSGHISDTVCSSTLVQMGSLSRSEPLPLLLLTPDLSDIAVISHQGKIITTITHFCIMFSRMTKSDMRNSTAFSGSVQTEKMYFYTSPGKSLQSYKSTGGILCID